MKRFHYSRFVLALIFLLLGFFSNVSFAECTLKMAYKESAKSPLIAEKPDNSGIYLELFGMAANRMGCSLEVFRLPKKRLHKMLEVGELDFYPGASFSQARAKYLYYIPNGMATGEYGVTNINVPEINSYKDLKGLDITWLLENGSSKTELAESLGIPVNISRNQGLQFLSKFIQRSPGNNFFYVADKELVDFFPRISGIAKLKDIGLKVHKNCCGGKRPMYMGFSRLSPNFEELKNIHFDISKDVQPVNFPTVVNGSSKAAKLGEELKKMKLEGATQRIYNKWFLGS